MTIREKVARAIDEVYGQGEEPDEIALEIAMPEATAAIDAFLAAAAEEGWCMVKDEATQAMAHTANGFGYDSAYTIREDSLLIDKYRAMLAAASGFEWDK